MQVDFEFFGPRQMLEKDEIDEIHQEGHVVDRCPMHA